MSTEKRNLDQHEYLNSLNVLGIDASATNSTIKAAYHKKVLQYHPDKGGNADKFIEIKKAYEYVKYYKSHAVKSKKETHIIKMEETKIKTKNITYKIEISLKDAYYGKRKTISLKRNRLCSLCKGKGTPILNDIIQCSICSGKGFITSKEKCIRCKGEGKIFRSYCKECQGNKVTLQTKEVEIIIKPGVYTGCKIIFENESEEYPGFIPGNVIFEIIVKEDNRIKRKGNDLYIEQNISLLNSLTGGVIQIDYFDKKLSTEINEVVPSGTMKRIISKGMPFFEDNSKYGDLIVKFNVVFPKKIDSQQSRMIQMALGGKANYHIKQKENINTFNLSNIKRNTIIRTEKGKTDYVLLSDYKESELHSFY